MGNSQSSYPIYYNVDINNKHKTNALTGFTDLACSSLGGSIVCSSNELFGSAKNLIKPNPPSNSTNNSHKGKLFYNNDAWVTKRHGDSYEWFVLYLFLSVLFKFPFSPLQLIQSILSQFYRVIIKLGSTGTIAGFGINSTNLLDDSAIKVSVEACLVPEEIQNKYNHNHEEFPFLWDLVLPEATLTPNTLTRLALWHETNSVYNFVKVNIFPDGGLSRFNVYGTVVPLVDSSSLVDLACVSNGGLVVSASNDSLGRKENLILPGFTKSDSTHGWVTRRNIKSSQSEDPSDWAIVKLGDSGFLKSAHVETTSLDGVEPLSFSIAACFSTLTDPSIDKDIHWYEINSSSPVKPGSVNEVDLSLNTQIFTHVKLTIKPDGGVSRLRIFGERATESSSSSEPMAVDSIPTVEIVSRKNSVAEVKIAASAESSVEPELVKAEAKVSSPAPNTRRRKLSKELIEPTNETLPQANLNKIISTENPFSSPQKQNSKDNVNKTPQKAKSDSADASDSVSTPQIDSRPIAKAKKPSSKKAIFIHSPGTSLIKKPTEPLLNGDLTSPLSPVFSKSLMNKVPSTKQPTNSSDQNEGAATKKAKHDPSKPKKPENESTGINPDNIETTPKPSKNKKSKKANKPAA
ncbi:Allantoicase [Smittium culicis]|uniref:Allantoicase n=1 Tax=Smittium culicis TaxID=133412 RepID=A0A1R1YL26_9FUNG|nr:Allantoicase [Smittium culicis]OMJ27637.1 Allantoicase [Smittium culicis]